MDITRETLEAELLSLPRSERARLVELLQESLDTPEESDQAWEEELDRRWQDYVDGKTQAVPAKEALARLRASLKR